MQRRIFTKKTRQWPTAVAVVMTLFGVTIWFHHATSQSLSPNTNIVDTNLPAGDESAISATNLLFDSVVSIIQSYYVDGERVNNTELLRSTIQALANDPMVAVEESSSNYTLKFQYQIFNLKVADDLAHQELLDHLSAMHRFFVNASGRTKTSLNSTTAQNSNMVFDALMGSLDPHSALLHPEAYRELRQGTEGSFGGLGVLVGIRDQLLTVIKPLPHSPAQSAGVRRRDRILSINGAETFGSTLDQLVEYMRGEPGTRVNLSLLRQGEDAPKTLTLQRQIINVDSVTSKLMRRGNVNICFMTIENFASRTAREVVDSVKRIRSDAGGTLHGVILDLRGNPGGLLDQAVQVADLFLKSGVIVTTRGRHQEVESADRGYHEIEYPVVILMNGDSASASEIVAGALQDHGRAVIVGQPSFGKGSVQTIFELPGDQALKLTIARYYTPLGRSIQNVGIEPDVWLQPVYSLKDNHNLMGPYRYKNERYMYNHLTAAMDADQKRRQHAAAMTGFYLTDKREEDDEVPEKFDRELSAATTIIEGVAATYGNTIPEGARRSSHWLSLVGPALKEKLQTLNAVVNDKLSKEFSVNWEDLPTVRDPRLEFKITKRPESALHVGDTFVLDWQIQNFGMTPVGRMSAFVSADVPGFETVEILVGKVAAGTTRTGSFKVKLPTHAEAGKMDLTFGLTQNAKPVAIEIPKLRLSIDRKAVSQLSMTATIGQEVGGRLPGVVESSEACKVQIDLVNNSKVDAHNLKVYLLNLAGEQVRVNADKQTLADLKSGQHKIFQFELKAGTHLVSGELPVGLIVESDDLLVPWRQHFTLKAIPNGVATNFFSH